MDCYPLDITVISADGIKNVNMITKMDVYVVVSINGDPSTAQKSHADKEAGSSPRWNHHVRFDLDDYSIKHRSLLFVLKSDRALGDKDIGEVSVPITELFDKSFGKVDDDSSSANKLPAEERVMEYQVRTTSGKMKGTLKFAYKFGKKYTREIAAPPAAAAKAFNHEPVMAYPAGPSGSYPYYPPQQPGMMYPGAPAHGAPYPYAAPPPQAGYGGYPPPPQQGYGGYPPAGYPPQPMGYGGYQQPIQPKKKKGSGSKLGLGLGAGLLGGLLVGDMIGDVGEMAAYDAGNSDGFGDGGDFDL